MSTPYWVRLRGCGGPEEWDKGRRFGGEDAEKGVEVLVASWDGAVIIRMKREGGRTVAKISQIPWGRPGETKGVSAEIFEGVIGVEIRPIVQEDLFGNLAGDE